VNEVRYKRDKNLPLSGPVSIEMMFEKYMEYALNKGRAGSTLKQHRDQFNNHVVPFYKGVEMKSVTVEEHEEFFQRLKKNELGPASCNRIRSLMSVIYSTSIKKRFFGGVFKENPFIYIEKMLELRKKIAFWDMETMGKFLDANTDSYYYPLWLFLLNTGLRIGEACAVHREQIDYAASIVSVDRTWSDHENAIVHRTKSKKVRHVGLNNEALCALKRVSMNEGHVFLNPDGTPILPDHVRKKLLPAACKKAGVVNIGPHGFRHTYASQYMMGGGNIWDLSKVLGHSTVQLTEQYYAHFSREHVLKRARIITRQENVISANFGVGGGWRGG
jgi:integrase